MVRTDGWESLISHSFDAHGLESCRGSPQPIVGLYGSQHIAGDRLLVYGDPHPTSHCPLLVHVDARREGCGAVVPRQAHSAARFAIFTGLAGSHVFAVLLPIAPDGVCVLHMVH